MTPVQTYWRRVVPLALAASAFAAMAWYVLCHPEQWSNIAVESPSLVGLTVLACGSAMFVQGLVFRDMTARLGTQLAVSESTCLSVMTSTISLFLPLHGGMAFRGLYLQKKHGMELSKFASTFIGYNIARLWVASCLACASGGWFLLQAARGSGFMAAHEHRAAIAGLKGIVVLTAVIAFAAPMGCLVQARLFRGKLEEIYCGAQLLRVIYLMHDGWRELVGCRWFLFRLFGFVVLQIAAEVLVVWAAWNAVGAGVSFATASLLASLGLLAALTGLTPGGVGLVELVSVGAGMTVAVEASQSIAAGLVARGASLAIMAIGCPLAMYWLARLPGRQELDTQACAAAQRSPSSFKILGRKTARNTTETETWES